MYRFTLKSGGKGQIQIDDFIETFNSDLSFWSISDYEAHWLKASEELALGNNVSFITSITNLEDTNFIRTWTCYVCDHELVFQENILFLYELSFKFNIAEPHNNVLPYESLSEDGEKISEWRTSNKKYK